MAVGMATPPENEMVPSLLTKTVVCVLPWKVKGKPMPTLCSLLSVRGRAVPTARTS